MASLGAAVFPQDPLGYCGGRELFGLLGDAGDGGMSSGFFDDFEIGDFLESQLVMDLDGSSGGSLQQADSGELGLSPYTSYHPCSSSRVEADEGMVAGERPKRRRGKSRKNKEERENQRMTHIAVERNRRKQMNEYLSILRSLMPEAYVQRGDQASIIGGAINFVKELEQQVHLLGARKQSSGHPHQGPPSSPPPLPFSDCFSLLRRHSENPVPATILGEVPAAAASTTQPNEVADVEVTVVESHASMKIRTKRRPKQLLMLVSGLHALRLTVLHLNVSTVRQVVLYSLSLKVEDDCKLTSVDEITSAVNQILVKIHEVACVN